MSKFDVLKREVLERLKKIKSLNKLSDDNFLEFSGSISRYLDKDYTNAELAKEILDYQFNKLSFTEMKIYHILYSASEDTKAKLSFGFPKQVRAFNKYGRTGITTLSGIIDKYNISIKEENDNRKNE